MEGEPLVILLVEDNPVNREVALGMLEALDCRVDVVVDTHPEALVVPRSALVAEGRRWHLFRLVEDGKTVERLEERGYVTVEEGSITGAIPDGTASPYGAYMCAKGLASIDFHNGAEERLIYCVCLTPIKR